MDEESGTRPEVENASLREQAVFKKALTTTVLCVASAAVFWGGVHVHKGPEAGTAFVAAYLVEQSLSVDNLFVFLMLFNYFKVPLEHQGRVLTWGILGAIAMRGVMLWAGVEMVEHFHVVILFFAGVLLVSAVKLFSESTESASEELSDNCVMKLSKRLVGVTDAYDGDRFFTVVDGQRRATPLFLCLVCIELSDFVFAVDSIPAVIGVSQDLLVVYSSNVFAILGLRSLYTLVAKAVADLPYLRPAVALVLAFVGLKMVAEYFGARLPTSVSLAVVASLLGGGVLFSIVAQRNKHHRRQAHLKLEEASGGRMVAPSPKAAHTATGAGASTASATAPGDWRTASDAAMRVPGSPYSSSCNHVSSSSCGSGNKNDTSGTRLSPNKEGRRTGGKQSTDGKDYGWWPTKNDFWEAFRSPYAPVADATAI